MTHPRAARAAPLLGPFLKSVLPSAALALSMVPALVGMKRGLTTAKMDDVFRRTAGIRELAGKLAAGVDGDLLLAKVTRHGDDTKKLLENFVDGAVFGKVAKLAMLLVNFLEVEQGAGVTSNTFKLQARPSSLKLPAGPSSSRHTANALKANHTGGSCSEYWRHHALYVVFVTASCSDLSLPPSHSFSAVDRMARDLLETARHEPRYELNVLLDDVGVERQTCKANATTATGCKNTSTLACKPKCEQLARLLRKSHARLKCRSQSSGMHNGIVKRLAAFNVSRIEDLDSFEKRVASSHFTGAQQLQPSFLIEAWDAVFRRCARQVWAIEMDVGLTGGSCASRE